MRFGGDMKTAVIVGLLAALAACGEAAGSSDTGDAGRPDGGGTPDAMTDARVRDAEPFDATRDLPGADGGPTDAATDLPPEALGRTDAGPDLGVGSSVGASGFRAARVPFAFDDCEVFMASPPPADYQATVNGDGTFMIGGRFLVGSSPDGWWLLEDPAFVTPRSATGIASGDGAAPAERWVLGAFEDLLLLRDASTGRWSDVSDPRVGWARRVEAAWNRPVVAGSDDLFIFESGTWNTLPRPPGSLDVAPPEGSPRRPLTGTESALYLVNELGFHRLDSPRGSWVSFTPPAIGTPPVLRIVGGQREGEVYALGDVDLYRFRGTALEREPLATPECGELLYVRQLAVTGGEPMVFLECRAQRPLMERVAGAWRRVETVRRPTRIQGLEDESVLSLQGIPRRRVSGGDWESVLDDVELPRFDDSQEGGGRRYRLAEDGTLEEAAAGAFTPVAGLEDYLMRNLWVASDGTAFVNGWRRTSSARPDRLDTFRVLPSGAIETDLRRWTTGRFVGRSASEVWMVTNDIRDDEPLYFFDGSTWTLADSPPCASVVDLRLYGISSLYAECASGTRHGRESGRWLPIGGVPPRALVVSIGPRGDPSILFVNNREFQTLDETGLRDDRFVFPTLFGSLIGVAGDSIEGLFFISGSAIGWFDRAGAWHRVSGWAVDDPVSLRVQGDVALVSAEVATGTGFSRNAGSLARCVRR